MRLEFGVVLAMRTGALTTAVLITAAALAAPANAVALDASKALSCAVAEASECDGVAQCRDVSVAEIDMSEVVTVDFAAKELASPDRQRTSPIYAVETLDAVLVLQGHQNGRGWTMVVERATGHLSATVAEAAGVFVLAGVCTAH